MNSSFWDFSKPTFFNITFWILASFLILALISVIIWRIVSRNDIRVKKQVGTLSKKMNNIVLDLSANKDFQIIYNIVFKNKYAKENYSLLPILIIHKKNVFLISNLIEINEKYNLTVNDDLSLSLIDKTNANKIKDYKSISLKWYREIEKYINRELIKDIKLTKIALLSNEVEIVENKSDFIFANIWNLSNVIAKNTGESNLLEYDLMKMVEKLNASNMHKMKVNK
ncbi:hypothetical protein NPA07_00970 [Mycoplasmopsis caviae]|uniref:Uncharacterized protein n=1 Tax=Mycoplasmopsis caviae TaxID=55603 RepID=A0A3P8LAJ6_9BACT|nr:hypothetical protein [Mycoplasmopsis caviae]UUD35432.1 hypothetical protein NPA07_00970 [Mycoplasmopsis caviae]VDR41791.1 Uncharacterised protein [Mycoplasmopsis caviae]